MDSDDLFVIDKRGSQRETSSNIIYDFKVNGDLGVPESNSMEPRPVMNPRQRRGPVGKRYHETEVLDDFDPGFISDELREALGLAAHMVPWHIYRMRTLGYPPGWLRKARVGGELTIFDSVTAMTEDSQISYNRNALVTYPGFNAPVSHPLIDQSDELGCPRMQSHHLLNNFYAALSQTGKINRNSSYSDSPSNNAELKKLRSERERILEEIRQLDSNISKASKPSSNADSNGTSTTQTDSVNSAVANGSSPQLLSISAAEESTPTPNRLMASSTPASSSSKRPEIDAFSVGVQPFRPFENLPDTQGSYKRVLATLRNSRDNANSPSLSKNRSNSKLSSVSSSSFTSK